MPIKMSLHHRNGRRLDEPGEWTQEQSGIALRWNLTEVEKGLDNHDILMAWAALFAARAREICDYHNVDVETFEEVFPEFENRVTQHLKLLKALLNVESEEEDVGILETCNLVQAGIEKLLQDEQVVIRLTLMFPHIEEGGKDHREAVDFPVIPLEGWSRVRGWFSEKKVSLQRKWRILVAWKLKWYSGH